METSEAVTRGLSEAMGVQFVEGELTPKERETAKELARSKYARLDWHKERAGTRSKRPDGASRAHGRR